MATVPNWQSAGGFMKFSSLSASGTIPVYTVAWRIMDHPDEWSKRFIRFKDGVEDDVRGAAWVLKAALPELMSALKLKPSEAAIIPALSSKADKLDPSAPLAKVCRWLAKELSLTYLPDLLTKASHRSLHSLGAGSERDAEVAGKYKAGKCGRVRTVIVVDDLLTRGATLGEIARAIQTTNPGVEVVGVALGKNENRDFAESFGVNVSNDHVDSKLDALWRKAQR